MRETTRIIMEVLHEHVYAGGGKCACGETIGFPEKYGWAVFLVEHQANAVAKALRSANRLNLFPMNQPDKAAEDWLRAYLTEHGPSRWTEIRAAAAAEESLTDEKLRTARTRLGCIQAGRSGQDPEGSERVRSRASTIWRLP